MKFQAEYTMKMSEEELKEMIEFYSKHKYKQDIKVTYITHDTKSWTEGHGMMERDYTKADGLTIKCH